MKCECEHECTSDCRRDGCNCMCGEWHCSTKRDAQVNHQKKKRWSPTKGFRDAIISDGKSQSLREQVEVDDREYWAHKEVVPFAIVKGLPVQKRKRSFIKQFIA